MEKANIQKYINNMLLFIIADIIIDIAVYVFLIYLGIPISIKYTIGLILIISTVFLIFLSYYNYKNFKEKLKKLKSFCNENIFYNEKKNALICEKEGISLCISLDYNKVYLNKIENYIDDAEDTNDFYCTRFEEGSISEVDGFKIFKGIFRTLQRNKIKLCSGKSVIINKINDEEIKKALNLIST